MLYDRIYKNLLFANCFLHIDMLKKLIYTYKSYDYQHTFMLTINNHSRVFNCPDNSGIRIIALDFHPFLR